MKKRRDKVKFEDIDDGRAVANMNVDGMPWYASPPSEAPRKVARQRTDDPDGADSADGAEPVQPPPLDKRETRGLIANALLATLLIAGIFALAAALFILFCTNVWFA